MIFPKPCTCKIDRKGIDFSNVGGWIKKVREEYKEVMRIAYRYEVNRLTLTRNLFLGEREEYEKDVDFSRQWLAEELADLITVCISFLNWLGYDEEARSQLFKRINDKNFERGNFQ